MRRTRMLMFSALLCAALGLGSADAALAHCGDGMVHRVNALRASHGLGALRKSNSLERSSERYSRWMMRNDFFGHQGRIRASSTFSPVGEVLSIHAGHSKAVGRTVGAWATSPGHAAVLLGPSFRYIGTGRSYGRFNGGSMTMWVVHVGAS